MKLKRIRLGDLLVDAGVINQQQLEEALREQKSTGQRLGRVLVSMGYVDEKRLLQLLAKQLDIEFIDLSQFKINTDAVSKLNEMTARRLRALVIDEKPDHFIAVMADPTDLDKFDQLQAALNKPVKLCVATETEIINNIDNLYQSGDSITSLAEELEDELTADTFDLPGLTEDVSADDAPVAKLLQSLFEQAIRAKASDIHIEPDENVLRVRMRVDGLLQEQLIKETRIVPALVLRLKLMCGLDISEKRKPQDGRFRIRAGGHDVDVRLSTMPIQHGESVVMRLLDQSGGLLRLEQTGIEPKALRAIRRLLKYPHGLVLVTGPTGSGKTTTLYAALTELNQPDKKIITIEDPVEYKLSRINQVQVNPKIGLTFASVLRAILRQDPDIILVGEMRDQETAEIGLRAAVTGHLVLSTLHTNDTLSAAIRLTDMGVEPYLLASGLRGIIAQRLVRRVCSFCSTDYQPSVAESEWLANQKYITLENVSWKQGSGCPQCNNTGYRGRAAIFEILLPDKAMLDAIRRRDQSAFDAAAAASEYYTPLAKSALQMSAQGITSLQEVMRVCESIEDMQGEF